MKEARVPVNLRGATTPEFRAHQHLLSPQLGQRELCLRNEGFEYTPRKPGALRPGDPTTQRMETGDEALELRLLTEPLRYSRDFSTGLESHEPCLYTTPQG